MRKEFSKALNFLKEANDLIIKNDFTCQKIYLCTLALLGFALSKTGELDQALENALKAKRLFEEKQIENENYNETKEYFMSLNTIGFVYYSKKSLDKAFDILSNAESQIKKYEKRSEINILNLYYLGLIHYCKENSVKALDCLVESHNISEDIKYEDNEYHKNCLEKIIDLYNKMERTEISSIYVGKLKKYKN